MIAFSWNNLNDKNQGGLNPFSGSDSGASLAEGGNHAGENFEEKRKAEKQDIGSLVQCDQKINCRRLSECKKTLVDILDHTKHHMPTCILGLLWKLRGGFPLLDKGAFIKYPYTNTPMYIVYDD